MQIFLRKNISLLIAGAVLGDCAYAADGKVLQLTASVQSVWDSNFSRGPQDDEEQLTLTAAGLSFDKNFGRQRIIAKWRGAHYRYDEHPDFDGSTNNAQLQWKGLIGSQINTDVEWLRDSYLVDRLEFFGKDIVTRDDVQAKIGYGNNQRLSFHVGGRTSGQSHSNDTRIGLDFDEDEGFVDVGYQTSNKSSLFLRYRAGARTYVNPPPDRNPDELDFDYDQVELEALWSLSEKTNISAVVASFKRRGLVNDASGSLATLAANWQATEKLSFSGGYTLRQPAIGETSDSPTKIHNVFASAAWQYSSKISFSSVWRYSVLDYEKVSPELVRTEYRYNFSPLTVSYDSGNHWQVRVESGWQKNDSPLAYRDYVSRQISAGLFFRY